MFLRIVLLIAAIVVLVCAATTVVLLSARQSLQAGVVQLRAAQDQAAAVGSDPSLRALMSGVRFDLSGARTNFDRADSRLALVAPLVEHLGWVPAYGGEVAAAPHVAHAAALTTHGALALLAGLEPVARQWTSGPQTARVPVLLSNLQQGRAHFVDACSAFAGATASRRAIVRGTYPAALRDALQTLDDRLPRYRIVCRALALAPDLLGANGQISYLVVYQDTNELRATGGFIGSASLLSVRRGITTQEFDGSGVQDNLSVPPPEPVAYYNGEPGWLFRDSNWSPDFPTTAALERFFYTLDFHRDVPNIINVTPVAASDILQATGPVYVPEYGQTVTAANVGQLADYYAHYAPQPGPSTTGTIDTRRKQFIGIVVRHELHRLGALSLKTVFALGGAIGTAVEHGDILVNFRKPAFQSLITATGAAHRLLPGPGDYLYVVNTNLSYNKINPYVHVKASYTVRVRADRWLDARLTVRLHDFPAPAALERVALGPQAGGYGNWDDYATFLRIYTPAGAELIDQAGWTQPWSQGPAYGGTMLSGYLIVPRGTTRIVRLHYIVPPNVFTASHGTHYSLIVPHQPGSVLYGLHVTVQHDGTAQSWQVARPALDWHASVPITARVFAPIPLPKSLPPATQPPGWVEPHAFLAVPNPRG